MGIWVFVGDMVLAMQMLLSSCLVLVDVCPVVSLNWTYVGATLLPRLGGGGGRGGNGQGEHRGGRSSIV